MKRSTKVTSILIVFFLIIAGVIIGRTMIGKHFEKKFSKRPPPEIIVTTLKNHNFSQKLESFGTALPSKTKSFRLKKSELLTPIKFNQKVKKGDIIANLKTENIVAPFDGVLGKRGISDDILVSESSIILTLDDSSIIFLDLKIPEKFLSDLKKGLKIKATFAAYKDKIYEGKIESVASRVDAQTRSILARAEINNRDLEILPGSLIEIELLYEEKIALGIPDTALLMEGNKKFVYKIIENNIIKKAEIETGVRNQGNLEVLSGLNEGDKIVAEGLTKVRPGMKIKPINQSQ